MVSGFVVLVGTAIVPTKESRQAREAELSRPKDTEKHRKNSFEQAPIDIELVVPRRGVGGKHFGFGFGFGGGGGRGGVH